MTGTSPGICGDPVGLLCGMQRKYRTMVRVSWQGRLAPSSIDDLIARAGKQVKRALSAPTLDEMVLALWRIESLAFAFFDQHPQLRCSLADLQLPLQAGPPVHCGLAMAAALSEGFDRQALLTRIEAMADPDFIDFSYETIGLMLAASEADLFGALARGLGRLALLRCRPRLRPEISTFTASLPDHMQRLLAHGYGRMLFFKLTGLRGALHRAAGVSELAADACVAGVIAANTLINSRDLGRLVDLAVMPGSATPVLQRGLERGLLNSLTLLAWTCPGSLDHLKRAVSEPGCRRLREAVDLATAARAHGSGPPLLP